MVERSGGISDGDGEGRQGRGVIGEIDSGGRNKRMVVLGADEAEVAADGSDEVYVVGGVGGDGEGRGEKSGLLRRRP